MLKDMDVGKIIFLEKIEGLCYILKRILKLLVPPSIAFFPKILLINAPPSIIRISKYLNGS